MKHTKKLIAAILVIVLTLTSLAAFAVAETEAYNVALFTMSASGEFWSTVMNGARDAAEAVSYTHLAFQKRKLIYKR